MILGHFLFGNGCTFKIDIGAALAGTYFLDRRLQVVEPVGIREDIKYIHVHLHLPDGLPDFFLFPCENCIRIQWNIHTAPAMFCQKSQTALMVFAGNELLNRR